MIHSQTNVQRVNELAEALNHYVDQQRLEMQNYNKNLLESKLKDAQQEYQSLHSAYNKLLVKKNELDIELKKFYLSNSWRLTRPFRRVRNMLIGDFLFTKKNMKELIWQFFYKLYQVIPYSRQQKYRLAFWVLKNFNFFFKNTDIYQRWFERSTKITNLSHCFLVSLPKKEEVEQIISLLSFPDCPNPIISVIIPNYGNVPLLLNCLQSIIQYLPTVPTEYIVIDDASNDLDVLKLEKIKNLRLMINEQNLGFVRNCNRAATQAKGQYLFFLNSDTQVLEDWLDNLYQVFQLRPDCGLVGAKLIFADGSLQEAGGILWKDGSAWNYGRNDNHDKPQYNYLRETDYCSGAAILICKDLFDQLNGLDVRYTPAYCEDLDLAFAVRALGFKVYYQPKSVIIHLEGMSHGTDLSAGIKAYQVSNTKKFYQKWSAVLQNDHFCNAKHVFFARDRSRSKPCVLVIDRYVLTPDRDAGSKTIFYLITILLEQGYNVKFLPQSLLYDSVYTTQLQARGVEVLYDTDHSKVNLSSWLAETGEYLDYIFLSRPDVAIDMLNLLKNYTQAKIIFYGHDLHYARIQAEAQIIKKESLKKVAKKRFEEELAVWESVDVVCYPSNTEVQAVRRILPDHSVLRFPPYFFDSINYHAEKNLKERADIIFIAGFTHRPNVDAAEWFVHKIFPLIKAWYPAVCLYLIGSHPTEIIRALANNDIIVTGYVTEEQLAAYYQSARVAVVPLRYGAGIKNKVLEALSFGIPVVTTSVGAQGLPWLAAVADITDDVSEFAHAVCALLDEDDHWRIRSKCAAQELSRYFSKEIMVETIETLFMAPKKLSKMSSLL